MKARGEDGLAYMIGGNAVGRRKLNQEEDHGGPPVAGSVCGESHRTHNRASGDNPEATPLHRKTFHSYFNQQNRLAQCL